MLRRWPVSRAPAIALSARRADGAGQHLSGAVCAAVDRRHKSHHQRQQIQRGGSGCAHRELDCSRCLLLQELFEFIHMMIFFSAVLYVLTVLVRPPICLLIGVPAAWSIGAQLDAAISLCERTRASCVSQPVSACECAVYPSWLPSSTL